MLQGTMNVREREDNGCASARPTKTQELDFVVLVSPHREAMLACARRLSKWDMDTAEDVVQDSLERAFKFWDRFTLDVGVGCAEAALRGWLLRIVHNAFVDRYHHERRRARVAAEPINYMLALHGVLDESDSADDATSHSVSDECEDALSELNPAHAEIVRRVDIGGQSYRQVCDELDLPIGTVMSSLNRARNHLRRRLASFAQREYGYTNTGLRYRRVPTQSAQKNAR